MRIIATSLAAIAIATATPTAAAAQETGVEQSADLALAREAVDIIWPVGNLEYSADYLIGPHADRMLNTPIPELAEQFGVTETMQAFMEVMPMLTPEMGDRATEGEEGEEEMTPEQMEAMANMMIAMLGDKTIKQTVFAEDEHFDERLAIFREVMDEELPAVAAAFEEPVRDALAQAFAKRFTPAELQDIAAFADTPSGRKFSRSYITIMFEPEYYGGFMRAIPAVLPTLKPLGEKLQARMAHLPPMFPEPEVEECDENDTECHAGANQVEDEHNLTADELDEWADELEAEAAEYRRQAEELRAEQTE